MMNLVRIISAPVAKMSFEMVPFFQGMVEMGDLEAYTVAIDKEIVDKDAEDEKIVRTIKGATFTRTSSLKENETFLVAYAKLGTNYFLNVKYWGLLADDELTYECTIEKLVRNFDAKKMKALSSIQSSLFLPESNVIARLSTFKYGKDKRMTIEGERDAFFEEVYAFVGKE